MPLSTRRHFLRHSTLTAGGAFLIGQTSSRAAAPGAGETLKVGLIGCGGRGSGAAVQALKADNYIKLHAMGDLFADSLERSHKNISAEIAPDKMDVPPERRFSGMDAFQKVIDSGAEVIILATPPGFRPQQLMAAVTAGKHVFCEKPMAVDVPGVRLAMEAFKMAKEKNLALVAGFCWRYDWPRRAAFAKLQAGEIGPVTAITSTYHTSPVKPMPEEGQRPAGMSDVEWQARNWYNFSWLSGDGLVEQAVHSVDKISWAMGDLPPIAAIATGGRQVPAKGGNIFDHFHVIYEYPNGVVANMASRQISGCTPHNMDSITGTKGRLIIGKGPQPLMEDFSGQTTWRYRGDEKDMYQVEHDELFASIRAGKPINDGERMMTSTMLAILGRMAAYTGQRITWEQAMASQEDLAPDGLTLKDSFTPGPLPQPGVTKFS